MKKHVLQARYVKEGWGFRCFIQCIILCCLKHSNELMERCLRCLSPAQHSVKCRIGIAGITQGGTDIWLCVKRIFEQKGQGERGVRKKQYVWWTEIKY